MVRDKPNKSLNNLWASVCMYVCMSGMHGRMGQPIGLKIGMEVSCDQGKVLNYNRGGFRGCGQGGATKTLFGAHFWPNGESNQKIS